MKVKKSGKATFRFTGEGGSGALRFECKLDKKRFKPCSSPVKVKLDQGKHKFKVRAIDATGNVDPTPAVKRFKLPKK